MTPSIFPKQKIPSYWKGSSEGVLPQSSLDFIVQVIFCLGVWSDIFSLQKRFCPVYSCEALTEKARDPEVLHKLSEIHRDRENLVPHGVELPSFWKVQSQRWPWHWYYAHIVYFPWEKRGVMGHMWDILTLKPWEFNDGHHELLLWRYVEVDGKEDPLDGWSSWMNTIISICRLIATTLIRLPS